MTEIRRHEQTLFTTATRRIHVTVVANSGCGGRCGCRKQTLFSTAAGGIHETVTTYIARSSGGGGDSGGEVGAEGIGLSDGVRNRSVGAAGGDGGNMVRNGQSMLGTAGKGAGRGRRRRRRRRRRG